MKLSFLEIQTLSLTQSTPTLAKPTAVQNFGMIALTILLLAALVNQRRLRAFVRRKHRTRRAITQIRRIVVLERMLKLSSRRTK